MDINWFITSLIYGSVGMGLYWAYFNYQKIVSINLKSKRFLDSGSNSELKGKIDLIIDIGEKI